ncbi:hypothetical protein [Cohaesibacter gelatinilyticus]|uniref:Uncharacterized protein n=1 Tax=Cohaesibacter gelatinilyticus TaxID=372072 RepID=A0A285PHL1_9HYPH|nr:hypothetical protein [Cohaesibacter gelatinilyticus]SNZ20908.1 hypothetical protein SAMN06265368_4021 [Cohaesibacter gelatinilyticus]
MLDKGAEKALEPDDFSNFARKLSRRDTGHQRRWFPFYATIMGDDYGRNDKRMFLRHREDLRRFTTERK